MLLVIDGYNVTRADPATKGMSLEEQREALVRRLAARGSSILGAGDILLVFDGAGGDASATGRHRIGNVEVRFARTCSADDEIVSVAKKTAQKVVLVSDDVELARRVAAHASGGVEVRASSACFESAGHGNERKGRRPRPARDSGLPKGANRITEELKDLWLSDKE